MQATHQPDLGAWAWHHPSSSKWLQGPVNEQFIWCLHSGKFSVPDQRLIQTVVREAKTSFRSLAKLSSRLISAAGAEQLSAPQKLLLESTASFPPALTSSALGG